MWRFLINFIVIYNLCFALEVYGKKPEISNEEIRLALERMQSKIEELSNNNNVLADATTKANKQKVQILNSYTSSDEGINKLRLENSDLRHRILLQEIKESIELQTKEINNLKRNVIQNLDNITRNTTVVTTTYGKELTTFLSNEINKLKDATSEIPCAGQRSSNKIAKPIIYAINCAGPAHIDSNGIFYTKDPLLSPGLAHNWFQNDAISRANAQDYTLYRSVRHEHVRFGYTFPILESGNYVLVLKFVDGDVPPNQRVFDVYLNKLHTVIKKLDIYSKATARTAYDEYIVFKVEDRHIIYNGERSVIKDNQISVEFMKIPTSRDTALVAAMYVLKGDLDDVPKLPPIIYPNPNTSNIVVHY